MIQLLFTLVFTEMVLILTLLFKTPIRKLLIMGLDRLKQGRAPLVAQTVAGTLFVVLASSLYSIMKIQKRSTEAGSVNPTDQVLLANHLLDASLMGFSLFLGLMIDRLHYYIKELSLLRKSLKAVKKHNYGYGDVKSRGEDESKALETKNKQLESESKTKLKVAKPQI